MNAESQRPEINERLRRVCMELSNLRNAEGLAIREAERLKLCEEVITEIAANGGAGN